MSSLIMIMLAGALKPWGPPPVVRLLTTNHHDGDVRCLHCCMRVADTDVVHLPRNLVAALPVNSTPSPRVCAAPCKIELAARLGQGRYFQHCFCRSITVFDMASQSNRKAEKAFKKLKRLFVGAINTVKEEVLLTELQSSLPLILEGALDINRSISGTNSTILHASVWNLKRQCVEWLVQVAHADVNVVTAKGNTPLHFAVSRFGRWELNSLSIRLTLVWMIHTVREN